MSPEEPKKSAEDLLQRYAKERRAQAGEPALHPATRRLLQGEVTRQFGSKQAGKTTRISWLNFWRSRIMISAAAVVIVGTGAFVLFNEHSRAPAPVELAGLKATGIDSVASRSLHDELQRSEASKPMDGAAVSPAAEAPPSKRAEAVFRRRISSGDALSDDLRLKSQSESEVMLRGFASGTGTATNGLALSFFADISESQAVTNSMDYTVSLAPALNGLSDVAGNNFWALRLFSFENRSPTPQENFAALALGSAAGQSASAPPAASGALLANGASLRPEADRFYRAVVPAVPGSAKDGANANQAIAQLSDLAKAESAPAPAAIGGRAVVNAPLARSDASGFAVLPSADKKLAAEELASTRVAEMKEKADFLQSSREPRTAPSSLAANESDMRFRRIGDAGGEDQIAATELRARGVAPDTSTVLSQFTVEQRGETVRVIDADGSRYDGSVDTPLSGNFGVEFDAPRPEMEERALSKKAPGLQEAPVSQAREYSFRASGSNVTLRQIVVVSGKFTQPTNALPDTTRYKLAGSSSAAPVAPSSATARNALQTAAGGYGEITPPVTNSPVVIEGTVRIGVTNLQWFRAVRDLR